MWFCMATNIVCRDKKLIKIIRKLMKRIVFAMFIEYKCACACDHNSIKSTLK